MFDGTVRRHQAKFMIKILPVVRRALDGLLHEGCVFRMSPPENEFHGRFRRSVVLENSKGFFGPDDVAVETLQPKLPVWSIAVLPINTPRLVQLPSCTSKVW